LPFRIFSNLYCFDGSSVEGSSSIVSFATHSRQERSFCIFFLQASFLPFRWIVGPTEAIVSAQQTQVQDVQQRLSQLSRFLGGLEPQVEVAGTKGHATYERLRDLVIFGEVGFVLVGFVLVGAVFAMKLSPFVICGS
jgi:hypothetical protein